MIFLKIKEKKQIKRMRTQKNTPIWLQEYRQPYAKHFLHIQFAEYLFAPRLKKRWIYSTNDEFIYIFALS